jgi:uncharacterized protein (DUF2345 family)
MSGPIRSSMCSSSTITVWEMNRTRHTARSTTTENTTTDAKPPLAVAAPARIAMITPRITIMAQPICVCRYAMFEA